MIKSFKYTGKNDDLWDFDEVTVDKLNLIVGVSGSGKTRFLNSLFNCSTFIRTGSNLKSGTWQIKAEHDEYEYIWKINVPQNELTPDQNPTKIESESIERRKKSTEKYETLVSRDSKSSFFMGNSLPKLSMSQSILFLLREEETVAPLFEVLGTGLRRSFQFSALERVALHDRILSSEAEKIIESKNMAGIFGDDRPVNIRLYLLKNAFPKLFEEIIGAFFDIFTTLEKCDIKVFDDPLSNDPSSRSIIPSVFFSEKGVKHGVTLDGMSSGMQKVLLILTDIVTIPEGCFYIIDEYENSLGLNAIDFLPSFLLEHGNANQFFITTHHPYLINNIDMKYWKIFNRQGSKVNIKTGADFAKKHGKSKQAAFTKLINDDFYSSFSSH